jgi:hypothetical protein
MLKLTILVFILRLIASRELSSTRKMGYVYFTPPDKKKTPDEPSPAITTANLGNIDALVVGETVLLVT